MIGADELAFKTLAALAVDDVTIDFTVAIDDASFKPTNENTPDFCPKPGVNNTQFYFFCLFFPVFFRKSTWQLTSG
jgi:hypothetical protein